MKFETPIVIDTETLAIEGRPDYPPKMVGVSIKLPGEKSRYFSFGHPVMNNSTRCTAGGALSECFKSSFPLLFHNCKFDLDVIKAEFGLPLPRWQRVHDTLFLLFFADPYATSYALKPSAERILGRKPKEQDAVRNWLIKEGAVKPKDRKWGAHISKAPGDLVGRYANADDDMTLKLFQKVYPKIIKDGMAGAYDRERQLMPILLQNETDGIRVDHDALRADTAKYKKALLQIEQALNKRLGTEIDYNSTVEIAHALRAKNEITRWHKTKTGKDSTAKQHFTKEVFKDTNLWLMLGYRGRLNKSLNTYMEPWLRTADKSGGRIFVGWNQVRQSSEWSAEGVFGARTGRPSTSPNLLAVTKSFYDRGDGYEHPKAVRGLPALPTVRNYILPDKDEVFVHRDYNQQEFRILAHFENAGLCKAYKDDPNMDAHTFMQQRIKEISNIDLPRRSVKTLNFGILYGMGRARLAKSLGITEEQAKELKMIQRRAVPGLAELERELRLATANGGKIRTWGGRLYPTEPRRIVDYENDGTEIWRTFEYKLLNYLIQGSAADATKQAIINYNSTKRDGRFLLTVYDEINISVPAKAVKSEMKLLKEAMEAVKFDVPMVTDGKVGDSWASLEKYND